MIRPVFKYKSKYLKEKTNLQNKINIKKFKLWFRIK